MVTTDEESEGRPDHPRSPHKKLQQKHMEERVLANTTAELGRMMIQQFADMNVKIQESVEGAVARANVPMMEHLNKIEAKVDQHEERLGSIEKKMADLEEKFAKSMVETALAKKETEMMQWKIGDLDDRGRRDNLRIPNLPANLEGGNAIGFLDRMLKTWFPTLKDTGHPLTIQRAHRVKTRNPNGLQPFIFKMLHHQAVRDILEAAKKHPPKMADGTKLRFYPDFGPATVKRRASFKEVKAELWSLKIEHFMVYPAVLKVQDGNTRRSFNTPEEVEDFIRARPSGSSTAPPAKKPRSGPNQNPSPADLMDI